MYKINYLLILFILLLFTDCKKNRQYVPNVYLDLIIYVNEPQNINLVSVGGWKYFAGGNRGVIVYRKGFNEFAAYERTCPYLPEEPSAIVAVDTTNKIILKDLSCNSQFLLCDGSPISGSAVFPLRQFRCIFDGTVLRVTN